MKNDFSLDYFVMLYTQNGSFTPMMHDDDIARYPSQKAARDAARNNLLGEHFGFDIFRIGDGSH